MLEVIYRSILLGLFGTHRGDVYLDGVKSGVFDLVVLGQGVQLLSVRELRPRQLRLQRFLLLCVLVNHRQVILQEGALEGPAQPTLLLLFLFTLLLFSKWFCCRWVF